MDKPQFTLELFPQEIGQSCILQANDLQTLGRFGQTCRGNNEWSATIMQCRTPQHCDVVLQLCSSLRDADKFDACTKVLQHYAKQYRQDEANNSNARLVFHELWQCDRALRAQGVECVLQLEPEISGVPLQKCLSVYAGEYGAQEMGTLCSLKTSLAEKMKAAARVENSCRLKKFLVDKNFIAAKTLLLSDHLLLNLITFDKPTLLECVCKTNDFAIVDSLVRRGSGDESFEEAIVILAQQSNSVLLEKLIDKYYNLAFKKRFLIWRGIATNYCVWQPNKSIGDLDVVCTIFKIIVKKLFPQEIDVYDDFGDTLLGYAAMYQNALAVSALLECGADVNIVDNAGFVPLHNAFLRTESDATVKVVQMLLKYGADVDCSDIQRRSVLHLYAAYSFRSVELIQLLLNYGAKIDVRDDSGKTPIDYARENHNQKLAALLEEALKNQKH